MLEQNWSAYTQSDYQRFKRWGLNAVMFELFPWAAANRWGLEPDPAAPQAWNETNLQALQNQVALAEAQGLTVFFSMQFYYHGSNAAWCGWADDPPYGNDYVNLTQVGRDRWCALLTMLARRFPTVYFDPWRYPYHGEENLNDDTRRMTIFNVTWPALVKAIRDGGNMKAIILNGHYQGYWNGEESGMFIDPYFKPVSDRNIIYGTNGHDSYNSVVALGYPWNQDVTELERQWGHAVSYARAHQVGCVEFGALNIHEYPADASRLSWLNENLRICQQARISWFYHRYELPPVNQCPINADGSDSQVAALLAQYAPTPSGPGIGSVALVVGGLLLISGLAYALTKR